MENNSNNKFCHECRGERIIKEKDGSVHTCWTCLMEGRLDAHSKNLPDSDIKI